MSYKYERNLNQFVNGSYAASIVDVKHKKSKKNNEMFIISLEGNNEEQATYFLVFGNNYTRENLNYLLSSIEDNGYEIPQIPFGYNKRTLDFLINKDVYIEVEMQPYNGVNQPSVKKFLTLEEFENSEY